MSLLRYIRKLQMIDMLIRKKSTGNQRSFCKKTCMSRSLLNNYIKEMKELGFPIEYDKRRETYYYKEEGSLVPRLFTQAINKADMKKIEGGCHLFILEDLIKRNFLDS